MSQPDPITEKAKAYYDSSDADNFYFQVWGGEDIHVGIYRSPTEPIREASHRSVVELAKELDSLAAGAHVLDIGAGYGGTARYLARERGLHVTCLNLSVVQNERNRKVNAEQGLSELIDVVDGSFEDLPFEDATFDAVISQDAILHSGNRESVFREADRVLKRGGIVAFTDPMQRAGVEAEALAPVLARIHLATMGSVEKYRHYASKLGWDLENHRPMPEQLVNHYRRVREELEGRRAELKDAISPEYVETMIQGLGHWIEAGSNGRLDWGILRFRKR